MQIAVDISLYPLHEDFVPPIKDVIGRLNGYDDVEVETNRMSTQLRGEYETVMRALTKELKKTFDDVPKAVFAIRILNDPLPD